MPSRTPYTLTATHEPCCVRVAAHPLKCTADKIKRLFDNQQHVEVILCTCTGLQELVHQHSIFKLLAQASDRALQLLSRATSKERTKPALLKSFVQLQMLMPIFIIAWNSCTADLAPTAAAAAAGARAGAAAGKQLVLQQLEETGSSRLHSSNACFVG